MAVRSASYHDPVQSAISALSSTPYEHRESQIKSPMTPEQFMKLLGIGSAYGSALAPGPEDELLHQGPPFSSTQPLAKARRVQARVPGLERAPIPLALLLRGLS